MNQPELLPEEVGEDELDRDVDRIPALWGREGEEEIGQSLVRTVGTKKKTGPTTKVMFSIESDCRAETAMESPPEPCPPNSFMMLFESQTLPFVETKCH